MVKLGTNTMCYVGSVFWCDIHPKDNSCCVTGGEDDRAFIWNLNTGEVLFECKNHTVGVNHR